MSPAKEAMAELAKSLPDDCSWDDAMYQLDVRQKIEAALRDAEEGRLVSHEEVFHAGFPILIRR